MANPFNNNQLTGRVACEPTFFKTRAGAEFSCAFNLAVQRNYKNGGEYLTDFIPVRYEGENRMNFAHSLKVGDVISLTGAIKVEPYTATDGTKRTSMYVLSDNISRTPFNKKTLESMMSSTPIVDEELPYK